MKELMEVQESMVSSGDGESFEKLMGRIQMLESIFEIGRIGPESVNSQGYVTVESLWKNDQLRVFIPKNSASIQGGKSTKIISGACMFGGSWGLQILTNTNKKISLTSPRSLSSIDPTHDRGKKLSVDDQIHPAEAENIYRLVQGLSFLAKYHSGSSLSIAFHIPEVEYMLYALDLVKSGVIDLDLFSETCSAIHNRAEKLKKMYTKKLPNNIKTSFITPLRGIDKEIHNSVKDLEPLELFKCAEDGVFAQAINSGLRPNSFSEIALLSYSLAYWQHYMQAKADGSNPLAVETIEEVKIFAEAKNLSYVFGEQLGILPIYLPPKVVSEQKGDLYWMSPPSNLVSILKFISGAYKNENNK